MKWVGGPDYYEYGDRMKIDWRQLWEKLSSKDICKSSVCESLQIFLWFPPVFPPFVQSSYLDRLQKEGWHLQTPSPRRFSQKKLNDEEEEEEEEEDEEEEEEEDGDEEEDQDQNESGSD